MTQNILGIKLDILLKQIKDFAPDNYIEIGCYRSETLKRVADSFPDIKVLIGLDLFEMADRSEIPPFDGPPRTLKDSQEYVPRAAFIKGDSKVTINDLPELTGRVFVFIDGGHSIRTALSDIKNIVQKYPEAKIVIDDATMPEVGEAIKQSGYDHVDLGTSVWEIRGSKVC